VELARVVSAAHQVNPRRNQRFRVVTERDFLVGDGTE